MLKNNSDWGSYWRPLSFTQQFVYDYWISFPWSVSIFFYCLSSLTIPSPHLHSPTWIIFRSHLYLSYINVIIPLLFSWPGKNIIFLHYFNMHQLHRHRWPSPRTRQALFHHFSGSVFTSSSLINLWNMYISSWIRAVKRVTGRKGVYKI